MVFYNLLAFFFSLRSVSLTLQSTHFIMLDTGRNIELVPRLLLFVS